LLTAVFRMKSKYSITDSRSDRSRAGHCRSRAVSCTQRMRFAQ
jgi:hypothetical protein